MFHISDCRKYSRCPRLFHLEWNAPKREYQPYVRLDEEVSDLVIRKLGIRDYWLGKRGDPAEDAVIAAETYDWLVKARFEYGDLRVKVPFMHRVKDAWDVYFLFIGLYPHAEGLEMYGDTVWVLEQLGYKVGELRIVHLNASYVRQEELDVNQMFIVSDFFYNSSCNPSKRITAEVRARMKDPSELIAEMKECLEGDTPLPCRTSKCASRVRCRYYQECFPDEKREDDNSIVTLISSRYKYDMKKEGLLRLKEADPERIEGHRMQYAQIAADQGNGLYVDRMALRSWLDNIDFPITFLDFEWERFAIPPYQGMKPYDVLPFEYSIHIMDANRSLQHKVFLSIHDDRREMAESLLRDIPKEGSVIAYNAEGAEKIRIKELADMYPDLAEGLMDINRRMEDLQLPFESGTVYDTRMRGTWSLKTIMGMMDDESGYHDLDIAQGMDAVYEWRHLDLSDADEEEKQKIIENLKEYCGMDTYAMTVVFLWLISLADEEPV